MKSYNIGFNKIGIQLDKLNSTGYTICPECSHNRKQSNRNKKVLKVYPKTGYYECKHCDFKGRVDSDQWINEKHEIETGLKQTYKTNQPKQVIKEQPQIKPFYFNELKADAIEFLANRGISLETAQACKVAYNLGCLCFNYYKGNEVVGAKYRKLKDKFFWQHVVPKKYLYGLNDIENEETIIIVEGEFDKLAFYEAGVKNCVSVSQGAPNEGQQVGTKLQCLDNSIDYIKDAKKVILACDNDPNGRYLTKVLIERFGADRCAVVEFPEGCKDANDVLIQLGKEKLKELIETAKETPIEGVRTLQQAKSKMLDIYKNGFRKGTPTMIRELQYKFSFYKMWWNLWHGIPNSGKSAFVHFLMMCMSVHHGWKWAVFSPEHYPEEDFYIDMIELLTGRSISLESSNRLNEKEFDIAMEFIQEHFYFVYPQADDISNSCDNVLKKIKELKLSKNIDGFLIDPYNQLTTETSENIDRYLEKSLTQVDVLCNTHNLVGNIVAHPRTLYKEKGEDDYKKPTPYQIAGGAMWYNKAYCIGNVHRPFNQSDKRNTLVEIDIQKVKSHKRAGTPGMASMNFDIKTGWYLSMSGDSALKGAFKNLCAAKGMETTENTFTNKIKQSEDNLFTLDDCPF